MITLNEWQAAKEEFNDNAFKRFRVGNPYFYNFSNNDDVEEKINLDYEIEPKPLPELFDNDVDVYGENAYLMWEFESPNHYMTKGFKSNQNVLNNIFMAIKKPEVFKVKRKQSAALPFDLERAAAGDVAEWFNGEIWILCIDVKKCHGTEIAKITSESGIDHHISFNNLRMKYPPEVK